MAAAAPWEFPLFPIAIVVMWICLAWQQAGNIRNGNKGKPVHSKAIGHPSLNKHGDTAGYFGEFFICLAISAPFLVIGAPVFGCYVIASWVASLMLVGMIDERDRQRKVMIRDAILEQQRYEELYGEVQEQLRRGA